MSHSIILLSKTTLVPVGVMTVVDNEQRPKTLETIKSGVIARKLGVPYWIIDYTALGNTVVIVNGFTNEVDDMQNQEEHTAWLASLNSIF